MHVKFRRRLGVCGELGELEEMSNEAEKYLIWYYQKNIWKALSYRGIRTLKLPQDMWNYQEIIEEHNIDWIVETGTRHGGSGVFFADLLQARNASGRVISLDITHDAVHPIAKSHPKLSLLKKNSADSQVATHILSLLPKENRGRLLLILDSDHSADHVYRELKAFVPLMQCGDYIVVEDTVVNGHPVRPEFGPGPWEGVEMFKAEYPDLLLADKEREMKFGCTFAANGYYTRK